MKTVDAIKLFITSRRSKGLSPHTIRWYRGILLLFAQRFPILPLSPEAIEEFLLNCQAGDERRHGYYRALKCFYQFLKRRINAPNPLETVDPPRRTSKDPHWLTPEELDKLLAYPHLSKIKAALLFLVDTGARLGELSNLNISNLKETPWGPIAIVKGKTGTRVVPVSYQTHQALKQTLPFGYSPYRLRIKLSQSFKHARVRGSALTLRHTFGTLWEGDELVLQQIMGHANLATTKNYRHLRTKMISIQHHQYSPLNMILARTKELDMVY